MRDLVIGTAGHIDHGKTALVRALTGVDTDRLPAEKQRGITIDLGFASLQVGENRLALVDVPGHERFIRNMLAGASGLDLAMLIVAADDSVMPQTREHLEILRLLGLTGGLVVVTKSDLAESGWLDMVEEDIRTLTRGTFLEGSTIVRTSTVTGEGIETLRQALGELAVRAAPAVDAGIFRTAIDRSFTVAGHGTVVTGTVVSGSVSVGDELDWLPAGKLVRVRGLHRHDRPVEQVARGSRAAINLVGVHHAEIGRGDVLAAPGYLEASRVLTVELTASADAARPLRHRARYKVHLGTVEVPAVLSLLDREDVGPGVPRLAQFLLASPVAAVHGQPFVVRSESPPATLGGGRILQPSARRYRRRDRTSMDRIDRLRSVDPVDRVRAAIAFQGLGAWTERRISAMSGSPVEGVREAIDRLTTDEALVEIPVGTRRTIRLLRDLVEDLEDRVLRAVGRLHATRPRQSAIPRVHLAAELPDLTREAMVAGLIDRLKRQGKLVAEARTVALPGHQPKLSQGERRLKQEIAEAIRSGGISPPDAADLAALAGPRAAVVPDLLALLRDEQRVAEIGPSLFLDFDVDAEMREKVRQQLADGSTLTMAGLRDLLGTTRKYAVPIGEYLDRIGLTRREGDVRRLGESLAHASGNVKESESSF